MTSSSESTPKVSVICHTYNHCSYISDALESFLSQKATFPIEVVVHDDASDDGTTRIVEDYAHRYGKMIKPILQTDNQLSKGIRPPQFTYFHASGEFIALCEGDDYWISPDKLEKQIDALRRHPEVDLCVHPAIRLSMNSNRRKKAFNHGKKERIVPLEDVIARHDQFAPTASVVMRTHAAQTLPDWFFNEPGLPVGDFFIEAILGRKGVLYLPDTMSVYRRDVPGSYTDRFRRASSQSLEESLKRMLNFTERLRGMEGIPEQALEQRLSYIRLNYALQFLAIGDRERFSTVCQKIELDRHILPQAALQLMRKNQVAFNLGRWSFERLRRFL